MSTVTVDDYTKIKTTLFVVDNREYQCGHCLSKYATRQDAEAQTERSRESKACRVIRSEPFLRIEELSFSKCPGNFAFPEVLGWLGAFSRFQNGMLPFPGSYSEQPNKVIEVFNVFEAHQLKKAVEERKRAEAASRLKGGNRGR